MGKTIKLFISYSHEDNLDDNPYMRHFNFK